MLRRDTQPELEAGLPEGEESQLSEEEKAMMREEFESGLLEQGLQLERDKEVIYYNLPLDKRLELCMLRYLSNATFVNK